MIYLVAVTVNQTFGTLAGGQSSTKVSNLSFHFRIATSFGNTFKRLFYLAINIQPLTA
jgi:hypothetical protein